PFQQTLRVQPAPAFAAQTDPCLGALESPKIIQSIDLKIYQTIDQTAIANLKQMAVSDRLSPSAHSDTIVILFKPWATE
ncbi:MAG: hypothetical protein ACK5Q1_08900, partial [Limnobacter sp.]